MDTGILNDGGDDTVNFIMLTAYSKSVLVPTFLQSEIMETEFKFCFRLCMYGQVLFKFYNLKETIYNLKYNWHCYCSKIDFRELYSLFVSWCDNFNLLWWLFDAKKATEN